MAPRWAPKICHVFFFPPAIPTDIVRALAAFSEKDKIIVGESADYYKLKLKDVLQTSD